MFSLDPSVVGLVPPCTCLRKDTITRLCAKKEINRPEVSASGPICETRGARARAPPRYVCSLPMVKSDVVISNKTKNCRRPHFSRFSKICFGPTHSAPHCKSRSNRLLLNMTKASFFSWSAYLIFRGCPWLGPFQSAPCCKNGSPGLVSNMRKILVFLEPAYS